MIKTQIVMYLALLSVTFAQADSLANEIPTTTTSSTEIETLSLTFLRMSDPLSDLSLSPEALNYSRTFLTPGHFAAPFSFYDKPNYLAPLQIRKKDPLGLVRQVLTYASFGAAAYVAGAHLKKHWKRYKEDFGF